MRKIRQLTTELTFRCNAKCPACHRIKPLRIDLNDKKYTISLERFKQLFNSELLNSLEWLVLNGNFGAYVANTLQNLCYFYLFQQHRNHKENWLPFYNFGPYAFK